MAGNGEIRPPVVAPIVVNMQGCQIDVQQQPGGLIQLSFVHQSGALVFAAHLPPAARQELVRKLMGITIAREIPGS